MGIGRCFWMVLLGLVFWTSTAVGQDHAEATKVDFEREIEPILAARCIKCHGPQKQKEGLRLDRSAFALRGGDSGEPGIVAGDSAHSELFRRITAHELDRMPPEGEPLTTAQVALIKRWIDEGASWPENGPTIEDESTHWSFQPVGEHGPPQTRGSWGSSPIDAFVLQKLEAEGLRPSPAADRVTLIRRLYLDLHGLLPTPAQVEAFTGDRREDAWERLVEESLASPRYGERWAQHWLDIVQYADSHGFEMNTPRPNAYHYRDYVIDALNDDLPYDRFIFEQLAGDTVGVHAATGFLVAGAWDEVLSKDPDDTALQRQDELTAMVNTTGTALLGLTLGCARCHNHKFDPVPQRDFYSMTAVFAGVRHGERALDSDKDKLVRVQQEELIEEVAALRAQLPGLRPGVNSRLNVERFPEVRACSVRMSIYATRGGAEPCIDELEVWSGELNVARTATPRSSGNYANNPKHRLEHINDGLFGNPRSWISNQAGGGWIQLDLAEPAQIDRISWGRDREERFTDRTAVGYVIEVAQTPGEWQVVSGSQNRRDPGDPGGLDSVAFGTDEVIARIAAAEKRRQKLKDYPVDAVYAGRLEQPGATHRLYRGDVREKREAVAPDILSALGSLGLAMDAPEEQRRVALARGISDSSNPLTARVMANRIWHHHFGAGIVATPGDFGANGAQPSHPELLDWLAMRLMREEWSLKQLHRLILLSDTYRQASAPNSEALARDADTRLLWRFPPRRLEAEVIRDCILQLSGSLDLTMGGPGFSTFEPNTNYVRVYAPKEELGPAEWRRMVYMHKVRMEKAPLFGSFDLPDAGQVCPKRSLSTTAIQALNLFNGTFVLDQARRMAANLEGLAMDPVVGAYRVAYGRRPNPSELNTARSFIQEQSLVAFCRAILNSNELVFIP
ncbi:MAG: PSD1 and planctomycete cytochrome C domain-containing protein [Planctomycetota bacterium]|nr:PSD1 and planctomycete cytochrome C domain-containing protein [Planctomycetota bacterium]